MDNTYLDQGKTTLGEQKALSEQSVLSEPKAEDNRSVELLEKNRPQQQRAIRTYEAIISAAGELLCEVGLERISTNNIAERAGVTVPALYRYFPNKYAVLNALGASLLRSLNGVFDEWRQRHLSEGCPDNTLDDLYELLASTYRITRDFPGGLEILYGMHAIAPLKQVRLESHWAMAEDFGAAWSELYNMPCSDNTLRRIRLATEMGYMAVQVALEDTRMGPEIALRDGAMALKLYLQNTARQARREMN